MDPADPDDPGESPSAATSAAPPAEPPAVPPAAPPGNDNKELDTYYLPIYIITAVFGAVFILGPLAARKCTNKGIIRCCIMLTAFSMWLFWVTVYIAQMNPLIGPRLRNRTLAWVAHKWGNPAK